MLEVQIKIDKENNFILYFNNLIYSYLHKIVYENHIENIEEEVRL